MAEASVAIVTGGAQGIGASIVEALLKNGYKVCVADIQREIGEQFVLKMQQMFNAASVKFVECDVAKEEELRGVFESTLKTFSRIDAVFNNAGISERTASTKRVVEVNLIGPIIGCQLAIEYMGKSKGGRGGTVVNTASMSGLRPYAGLPIYSATKHGVVGLTRSYGTPNNLEKEGVIFAALCPSVTDTPFVRKARALGTANELALNNAMKSEYVAQAALTLLQDRINGSALMVRPEGYEFFNFPEV